ncbi:10071_t:CDS:2, partial [Gigaspora rosea]
MKTFGEHLQNLKVEQSLRYPIANIFKIIKRSRSKSEALELAKMYNKFILMLLLEDHIKEYLQKDLVLNWICDEWCMSFIDSGRLPYESDNPCSKPLTTNNFTERMNKSLKSQCGNTKTVVDFVENLYGIQKIRSILSEENSGQLNFHAGLVTYWNARTLEHENEEYHFAIDKKRRLNKERYYVLCGWIKNIENSDYFYVKKGNNSFCSPYNSAPIKINHEIQLKIDKMVGKLASKHNIEILPQYYLVNIQLGECMCLDFIWNSSFCDVCKHCHAARLFRSIQEKTESLATIKSNFVQYFRNKEKALLANSKNYIIYSGVEDEAFQEIVSLYNEVGDAIFYLYKRQLAEKDPFRPLELSEYNTMTYGSPKIHGAKKCNPSLNTALLSETYSTSIPIIDSTLLSGAYPTLEMHLEQYEQKEILPLQEKYVHSNTSNSQTIQTTLPHSIQCRNTTRIRNLKHGTQK